MEGKCIVSSCGKAASKCCGSCGWVRYCSTECQKEDWKTCHKKLECVSMKKLSSVSLTEEEIYTVAYKVMTISDRLLANGEHGRSIYLLKECIVFVKNRLGRLDSNLSHGMAITLPLVKLGEVYFRMARLSETDNHAISHLSEARELLIQRKDAGQDDLAMWKLLYTCDEYLFPLYTGIGQLEKAKYHAVQFVATARQYKGPDQADYLITALSMLSDSLRLDGSNCPESLAVAEEAYLIASKHYSPAHKMVLKASRQMINCLMTIKDYSTADTYCRINYANVIDPMNAGEYDVVDESSTMSQLVELWLAKEPDDDEIVEKALADEAIDLSRKVYVLEKDSCRTELIYSCLFKLCRVLLKANQLNEETEGLLHQLVKYCITNICLGGDRTYRSIWNLCDFYLRLHTSLPIGEKSTLVKNNCELCDKKLLELESCNDGSIDCIKGSQKIKPYFKNNAELWI